MARIVRTSGDILSANADALVNTVNCVGIMGRGIALQFKNAFPDNFEAYKRACDAEEVRPGKMFIFETGELHPKYIVNFPTKRHWKGKSRIEDIRSGLEDLRHEIGRRGIKSIAIPPLGSGLGGLDWSEVRPLIEDALNDIPDLDVTIYEPVAAPIATKSREVPKMTAGRAALVVLMDRYLSGLLDPLVTLLEVHKLMYFMQVAGENLKLEYEKAPYGPYAINLRHVLQRIEGHLLTGYFDGGNAPAKQLALVPGAVEDATEFLREAGDTQGRFSKVAELVEGFETPFGMELLATVHWVVTQEEASPETVVAKVHEWNARKRNFSARQIMLAYDVLKSKGWLSPSPLAA
jgi:O-acetyl-ADP-ribose deacetylase (regulator of RNase III)